VGILRGFHMFSAFEFFLLSNRIHARSTAIKVNYWKCSSRRPTSTCSRLATPPFFQVGLLSKLHFIEMLRATRKRLKYEALDTK